MASALGLRLIALSRPDPEKSRRMEKAMRIIVSTLALAMLIAPAVLGAEKSSGGRAMPMKPAKAGSIVAEQAWARASLTNTGAAYLTIRNGGRAPDRLIGVRTPVAGRAGLHTTRMDKGVMRMRPLKAIEIAPGGSAALRPGGDHIMLMGLTRRLKRGAHFPLTLRFAGAGEITVMVTVLGPGARGPGGTGHQGHGAPKKRAH
jgi:copper(I)-binding protein